MLVAVQTIVVMVILKTVTAVPQQEIVIKNVVPQDGTWGGPTDVDRTTHPGPTDVDRTTHPGFSGGTAAGSAEETGTTSVVETTESGEDLGITERPTLCLNIPDPGECRGAFPRFFYNETLDQCDCFLYGGCDNEALILSSTWLSHAECNDICRPGNTQEGRRCTLLPKEDIQKFPQSNILENLDTSHVSDEDFIDLLSFLN